MLKLIIAYSVRNPLIVLLGVIVMGFFGWQSLSRIPLDAVPDITNNQVQIVTQSPSLTAEEVEQFITYPLELTMINLPGVEDVRSISKFGLSILTVVFEENVPDLQARQLVAEQLSIAAEEVPTTLGIPQMMPITTGLGEIYQYVLTVDPNSGKNYSASELRTIHDWVIKRQLGGIEGVIEISSFGGYVKQFEIVPNPEKLVRYGVSIQDLVEAARANNESVGGSYYSANNQSFYVRAPGRLKTPDELNLVPVKTENNGTIYLRDVAEVKEGHAIRFGAMTKDGGGEVVGGISLMLKGDNAHAVVQRIEERVASVQSSLPDGVSIEPYLVRSQLVDRTTATVAKNLIEGGLIVIFVLVLLLGNIRAGLVVASVIPLAMLFALILMNAFGVSANLMSLGAIDFGIVVDGAVIITEHIIAVMTLNYMGKKLSREEFQNVISTSSLEMVKSAVFGVLIILVVFVPIITLVGIEGKMFRPMAQTVSFALLGALLLSITYVPAVLALVMKPQGEEEPAYSTYIISGLQRMYTPSVAFALGNPKTIFTLAGGLFVGAIVLFLGMGSEFIPRLDEGDLAVQMQLPPGTSLEESVATSSRAEQVLMGQFPQVRSVVSKIGTAEVPTDPMSIEQADIMVLMHPESEWPEKVDKEELIGHMSDALAREIPFAQFEFTQPIELRFNELISGAKSDVAIKIFGADFNELNRIADEFVPLVEGVEGAVDVKREQTDGLNQRHVVYDRAKMAAMGVSVAEANFVVQTAFAGADAGTFYEEDRRFDIVVRYDEAQRSSPNLNTLMVTNSEGQSIPLSAFATLEYHEGPALISRENSQRRIVVGANVRGRDIESVVLDIQSVLNAQDLPAGYYVVYGGDFEQLQEAKHRLSLAVPIALGAIFVLLFLSFRSLNLAAMVFVSVPLSTIGGVAALAVRGMPFSISAGIGFIALFGVAVLNGIVMISHLSSSVEDPSDLKAVLQAAKQRLRPVMMTAFVAALGFLPMALSTGSGAEVQKPLATVVIGGLITATLLTLVVLPAVYAQFGRRRSKFRGELAVLAAIFLLPLNARSQEVRTLDQAMEALRENNTAVLMGRNEVELVKAQNGQDLSIPLSSQFQRGQINSALAQDYFLAVELTIPSLSAAPALLQLHRARLHRAQQYANYVEHVQRTHLRQLWWQHIIERESELVLQRQYAEIEHAYHRIEQRVDQGLLPARDLARWEVVVETLHHTLKAKSSEVARLKSQIDAMVGWSPKSFWIPAEQELQWTPLAAMDASDALVLAPVMAEMDVAGVVLRREKSRWMPELGVGGFTQKLDGTPGFNGLQASASVPLSPGVYRNRVREGQINLSNSELEVVQAQREWETITTKLATDLERWKPEPHHSDRGEQTPEELWQLYESGALDLDGYWGAMSAKSERELLDIEHRFHYQKIIIEWNFYQSTAL